MRPVISGVGLVLHVPALMALASVVVCLVFQEFLAVAAFLVTALVAGILGQALFRTRYAGMEVAQHHAMLVAAISWLAVSLLGALPFLLIARMFPADDIIGVFRAPENALFESLSGFTATGLTMVNNASALPPSLQWWRSFSEWVGGVGVIVLMLSVLPPGRDALHLYYSEARGQKILPSIQSTTKAIWSVYILYTLAGIVLLWLTGEPLWRAINHGMTAIATGGFTITDDSLASAPAGAELVYLFIMVLGAISFLLHYRLVWRRGVRTSAMGDAELHLFLVMLALGSGLLLLEARRSESAGLQPIFHWVSALTTTGFQTAPLDRVTAPLMVLFIVAMTAGAMAGSTGGGIKQLRVLYILKGVGWWLKGMLGRPHQVMRYRLDDATLSKAEAETRVEAASVLMATWLVVLFLEIFVLLHVVPEDTRFEQVVFEVASAQGNVGLSTGLTHSHLPLTGKLVLMAAMWMGRLEIVPVLVLIFQVWARR